MLRSVGVFLAFQTRKPVQYKAGENKVAIFKHGGKSETVPLDIAQIRAALKK